MQALTKFDVEQIDSTYVVKPLGNLSELDDDETEPAYASVLGRLKRAGAQKVLVDLMKADYFGSSAISFFLMLRMQIKEAGGRMVLCNVSDHVHQILRAAHLDEHWEVFDSRDEALRNLA